MGSRQVLIALAWASLFALASIGLAFLLVVYTSYDAMASPLLYTERRWFQEFVLWMIFYVAIAIVIGGLCRRDDE